MKKREEVYLETAHGGEFHISFTPISYTANMNKKSEKM